MSSIKWKHKTKVRKEQLEQIESPFQMQACNKIVK